MEEILYTWDLEDHVMKKNAHQLVQDFVALFFI